MSEWWIIFTVKCFRFKFIGKIASTWDVIVDDELGRLCKEPAMIRIKLLSRYLLGGTKENHLLTFPIS